MSASPMIPDGGVAGRALREVDWSRNALGPLATWPHALRAHVRAMLSTRQPMCIFWGPELVNLHNDGFLPILGEKHPAAMGQRAEDCWKEAWDIIAPQLRDVLAGSNAFHEEVLVPIARDGRIGDAWFNYSYSPLYGDAGDIEGVLVICTEVTSEVLARRRMESAKQDADMARSELHGVFMQAPEPMCILAGKEHRFVLANIPFEEFVGRPVVGKTLSEAFTDEEVGYYRPLLDRVLSTGAPEVIREAPLHLNSSGNQPRFIDVVYYPHRDATGQIVGVLGFVHDVSEKVSARKKLEELAISQSGARKQADAHRLVAEAANRAKDDFLATVSHELRTPLTAILGWARILADPKERGREQGRAERIDKGLAVIERNASAQAKIIEDILDVSRIISGKLHLVVRPYDASAAITSAVDSIRPAATLKQIELRVDVDVRELGAQMVGDEGRLQQVFWNLLSNAVKFTPRGGAVSVRAFVVSDNVHFIVTDSGSGISSDFLPFVFDRFRQDDSSTVRQHQGLGLGLAIVRHLVELHGGTVSARSEGYGRGATFEVVLPARSLHASDAVAPPPPRSSLVLDDREITLNGATILVVDDQDDARDLVAVVLEQAGAHVIQAASVAAALELLESRTITALVSDIGMSGTDGYALAKQIRSTGPLRNLPALALTAFARAEDRERALASGFDQHMAKPIDPDGLVAALAEIIVAKNEAARPQRTPSPAG